MPVQAKVEARVPMQFRSVLMSAVGFGVLAVGLAAMADKSVAAGSTRLSINNSGPINLVTSVPVDYWNRSVANGRRAVKLRVGQPLLCADFATAPGGGSNPVSLQLIDPNNETGPLLFGGITAFDYFTNGTAASLFKVSSGGDLACCTMLPAVNAACYQGSIGGAGADSVYRNGFENPTEQQQGGPADLVVSMSGASTATAGNNYAYSITVTNNGGSTLSGLRVRDWYPKASGGFPATLSTSSWTCSPAGSCGTTSGNGNIVLDAASLAGNSSLTINATRLVDVAAPGASFSVSAAAFAPPANAESLLVNNQASLTAVIAQTTFSISDLTQAEGNSGNSNFQFTITRSNTDTAVSVVVNTANGSATAGSDYTAISNQTVNFSAGGSATATVAVSVAGDTVLEGNETFNVNLSNPSGASILDGQGVGTINNDDSASIAIADVSIAEGNSGTSNAGFVVTLTGAVQGGFTVPVSSSNGSATAGSDYTAVPGGTLLNFTGTAGETRTLNVGVLGDSVLEANETFQVILGSPSQAGVTVSDGNATGTINNDDSASLAINDVTVLEGNGGSAAASFTVTLTGAVQGGFNLPVSSANGSATAPSDYTAIGGGEFLSFTGTAGETRIATVNVIGDTVLEANETFMVNLGTPSNAAVQIGDGSGTGTINNDDSASISINDVAISEGNSGTSNAVFTVTLSNAVQGGFTVLPSTANFTATAPSDFAPYAGGALNFAGTSGETQTLTVLVNGDAVLEANENYFVNLGLPSNGAVTLGDAQGLGTINNDDSASLSINDVSVTEGNTGTVNATFTITLTGATQDAFEVPVSSADGSATVANSDYVAIPGGTTRAFTGALGETRTISVVVNGDTAVEPNETFTVNLGTPVGTAVTVSDAQGVGTINNDD